METCKYGLGASTRKPPTARWVWRWVLSPHRNELTVLKYIYQEQEDDFAIYLLVNDNWEKIHGMTID